jgi:hypothetical protein
MAVGAARMREDGMDLVPFGKPVGGVQREAGTGHRRKSGGRCQQYSQPPQANAACFEIGSERTRFPVSADTALASAAAAGGVPISPAPPIL